MSQLLPADVAKNIPELYATENLGDDAIIHVKFFTPWSFWDWYVIEYDGTDKCFGWVDGFEFELGYFLISELEEIAHDGMKIERDTNWQPITVGELKRQLNSTSGF